MDIRKVKKLIELLEESGIAEIEITEGEEAVRISRYPTSAAMTPAASEAPKQPVPGIPVESPEKSDKKGHQVLAPGRHFLPGLEFHSRPLRQCR